MRERVQMSAARHYCDFKACHNSKAAVIWQRSDHLCFWQMTGKCVVVCMQVFTQVGSCFSRDDCDHMRSLNTPPQKQSRIYNMLMHYVLFCEDTCRQRIKEDFKLQSRCMGAVLFIFLYHCSYSMISKQTTAWPFSNIVFYSRIWEHRFSSSTVSL